MADSTSLGDTAAVADGAVIFMFVVAWLVAEWWGTGEFATPMTSCDCKETEAIAEIEVLNI